MPTSHVSNTVSRRSSVCRRHTPVHSCSLASTGNHVPWIRHWDIVAESQHRLWRHLFLLAEHQTTPRNGLLHKFHNVPLLLQLEIFNRFSSITSDNLCAYLKRVWRIILKRYSVFVQRRCGTKLCQVWWKTTVPSARVTSSRRNR